jgi:anti-anti-sigma factor
MGELPDLSPDGDPTPLSERRTGARKEPQIRLIKLFSGDRCKLSLSGELKHGNAEYLFTNVQELFESGCTFVILDLKDVSYCDTAGLQSLVQVYKYLQSKKGLTFRIYATDGVVMDTLRTCRFDKFLQITQDASELDGFPETC